MVAEMWARSHFIMVDSIMKVRAPSLREMLMDNSQYQMSDQSIRSATTDESYSFRIKEFARPFGLNFFFGKEKRKQSWFNEAKPKVIGQNTRLCWLARACGRLKICFDCPEPKTPRTPWTSADEILLLSFCGFYCGATCSRCW